MGTHGQPAALVLLSGGVDSATALAVARSREHGTYALTFEYGQRHKLEVMAAREVARSLHAERHIVVPLDLAAVGGSALTTDAALPTQRSLEEIASGIPSTYVPARNTIFLAVALAWAEVLCISDIFIGANAFDRHGYPDCREEYLRAFETMANLATRNAVEGQGRIRIHAPLIQLSKAEILRLGTSLGVDFSATWSCYDPSPKAEACGACDACQLRLAGFEEAGMTDPARYRTATERAR